VCHGEAAKLGIWLRVFSKELASIVQESFIGTSWVGIMEPPRTSAKSEGGTLLPHAISEIKIFKYPILKALIKSTYF
jgi:hypothetical protein